MDIVLDELDRRILNALQMDAAQTNQELAQQVHASAPTCLRRVKRLIDAGIIVRQVALLSPEKLGLGLTALIEVTLDNQATEHLLTFEAVVAQESAILQCYRVSPGPDFILIAQVAEMAAYHALAHQLFTTQKNVRNVRTYFSIYRSKFETRMRLL